MAPSRLRVNKTTFLESLICPTRGWLIRRGADEPTEGDLLRMEEGLEVGRLARELFPEGVLIDEIDLTTAAERTQELMNDRKMSAIFEATFLVDQFATRVDILVRSGRSWKLLEVKSGVNPSDEYLEDLAYTLMVVRRAGVKISSAGLLLLSRDFRLGMDGRKLFVEHDQTDEARDAANAFDDEWDAVARSALASRRPKPKLIFACRNCPFCDDCHAAGESDHIFTLPRLSKSLFEKLTERKMTAISQIPDGMLTPPQERVRKAVVTGKPVIAKQQLAQFLQQVEWPAYYLDFETVKSAIPLFPKVAPHEQIATQYSLHVCRAPGKVAGHREFLADPAGDQRRKLAEQLLADLEERGSIIVYSSFEKTMLGNFARLFPDLRPSLQRCIDRLFDLEQAFRDHFYHPEFQGRTSIKFTLPALTDISYDGLPIGDGDTAVARYARMVRGQLAGKEAEAVRQALLQYCKQDTHAMVRLHEELVRHAGIARRK